MAVNMTCLVSLILLFAFFNLASAYRFFAISVKTENMKGARTDSTVKVKFGNQNGYDNYSIPNLASAGIMGPGHDYFETGSLDFFANSFAWELSDPVCYLTLALNAPKPNSRWFCEYVMINEYYRGAHYVQKFNVNKWLDVKEPSISINNCGKSLDDDKKNVLNTTAVI